MVKSDNLIMSAKRDVRRVHSFTDLPKKAEEDKVDIISELCEAVAGKKICNVTYKAIN